MLNTVSKLWEAPTESQRRSGFGDKPNLIGLPNEILLTVFDCLDVFDSAALALTCKHLANIASTYSKLDIPMSTISRGARRTCKERHFLKKRLGDKFFSKRLRYCWGCEIYVPRRKGHWKRKLGMKCWEGPWGAHKRGTFGEWWAAPSTQQMLAQWDKGKAFKCPRCKFCKAGFVKAGLTGGFK